MPRARKVLNAFTADEVTSITKLSRPMIDYLASKAFLVPSYVDETRHKARPGRVRGRVRYYSFRDLVIARIVQRLRESGIQLRRLKAAIIKLNAHPEWTDSGEGPEAKIRWLLSDGRSVLIRTQDGFLEDLVSGQRAFAFVLNLDQIKREVLRKVPTKKRPHCSLRNTVLEFDEEAA